MGRGGCPRTERGLLAETTLIYCDRCLNFLVVTVVPRSRAHQDDPAEAVLCFTASRQSISGCHCLGLRCQKCGLQRTEVNARDAPSFGNSDERITSVRQRRMTTRRTKSSVTAARQPACPQAFAHICTHPHAWLPNQLSATFREGASVLAARQTGSQ